MLIDKNDLTMSCDWIQVYKVEETGDLDESQPVKINCLTIDNKTLFVQNETGFSKIPAKCYILAKDTDIKAGDKLDGVFVKKVDIVNDLDGSVDHIEAYTV